MADVLFRNSSNSNVKDLNGTNIADATASAVSFTGTPGNGLVIDTATKSLVVITNGECDVPAVGTATYVAFNLTDNTSLALVAAP